MIAQSIPEQEWAECDDSNIDKCIAESSPADVIDHSSTNPTPSPSLCGGIIVMERQLVPYHYRDFYSDHLIGNRWAKVNVEC